MKIIDLGYKFRYLGFTNGGQGKPFSKKWAIDLDRLQAFLDLKLKNGYTLLYYTTRNYRMNFFFRKYLY